MICCLPGCTNDAEITIGPWRYCHNCRRLLNAAAHRIIHDLRDDLTRALDRRNAA